MTIVRHDIVGGTRTRRTRWRFQHPRPKMQLPLTPMIDVTFQLLLFFLLATTFRQAEGQIPGMLPGRQAAAALDQTIVRPIRITVLPADNGAAAYYLDDAPAPLADAQQLFDRLAALRQAYGSGEVPIAIRPRWDVPWQYVVEADNQAHRAGFGTVGIVSTP